MISNSFICPILETICRLHPISDNLSIYTKILQNGFNDMNEPASELAVINAIADEKSLSIFNSIAKGTVEGRKIQQTLGLSRKQYYSRTERMIKAGLISRKKGRFSLTALGIVSYHIELQLESAIKNYWNLKAIDSIHDLHKMDKDERIKIIKRIVTDKTIQSILETRIEYYELPK